MTHNSSCKLISGKIWSRRSEVNLDDERHVESMLTCDVRFLGRAETIWESEFGTSNKWLHPGLRLFDESEIDDTFMGSGFVEWRQLLSEESVIRLSRVGGDTSVSMSHRYLFIYENECLDSRIRQANWTTAKKGPHKTGKRNGTKKRPLRGSSDFAQNRT